MNKSETIKIPKPLFDNLKLQQQKSSFRAVDDFIVFILQHYLDQQNVESELNSRTNDDEEVLKRLNDLGYM